MSPVSLVFHTIVTWDWSLFAAMVVDGGHNEQWYKNCTKTFKKKILAWLTITIETIYYSNTGC